MMKLMLLYLSFCLLLGQANANSSLSCQETIEKILNNPDKMTAVVFSYITIDKSYFDSLLKIKEALQNEQLTNGGQPSASKKIDEKIVVSQLRYRVLTILKDSADVQVYEVENHLKEKAIITHYKNQLDLEAYLFAYYKADLSLKALAFNKGCNMLEQSVILSYRQGIPASYLFANASPFLTDLQIDQLKKNYTFFKAYALSKGVIINEDNVLFDIHKARFVITNLTQTNIKNKI